MTDQLTETDVKRLTSERKYAEIDQARIDGQLDRLLGVPEDEIDLKARAREGRITVDDVRELNRLGLHDLVNAAREDDRIDYTTEGL